jgi:ABC-2 type transport system permease protein
MSAQLRSELLKLCTTRTFAVVTLLALGMTLFGCLIEGISPSTAEVASEATQRDMFVANVTAVLFSTIAGLLIVTSEFRYGTIHPTLLCEPRRRVLFGAQLVAAALGALVISVLATAVSFGTSFAVLGVRGVDVSLTTEHALTIAFGAIGASILSALIGVAIGWLIRNQTGAIVALLAYAVALDAGLFAASPDAGRFLPGKAGDALAGRPVDDLLAPLAGAGVLVLWTLAFVIAAAVRTDRVDVEPR